MTSLHPHTLLAIYADDTAITVRNKNINYMHIHLQTHISRLENFFNKWRIKINPKKSQTIFSKKLNHLICMGSLEQFGREAKYLGIVFDSISDILNQK